LVRKGFSVPRIIPPSLILTTQAESGSAWVGHS